MGSNYQIGILTRSANPGSLLDAVCGMDDEHRLFIWFCGEGDVAWTALPTVYLVHCRMGYYSKAPERTTS